MSFYLKASAPFVISVPIGFWAYKKRETNLNHPVMKRAMLQLQQDKRVIDFCGDNLYPGYWISVNEDPVENYIKFGFTIKGSSGDLGTSIIADYLTHRELSILESERKDYFDQKSKLKKDDPKSKELDQQYIPIDFDSYSIEDKNMILNKKAQLKEEDKIWRISSLTAYVDDETKILLLPVPESKRQVKIKDTKYSFSTVQDLLDKQSSFQYSLIKEDERKETKRFEDMTKEEINEEVIKKRQTNMNKMMKIRKYQFLGFTGIGFFYFFIYRKFLHPKSVMNSVLYHNALKYIKIN